MEKFDIEYKADQEENEKYEIFKTECDGIQEKIETLEDKEDELLKSIEIYARSKNYRGRRKEQAYFEIESLAPRGKVHTDKRAVRTKPKANKSTDLKRELATVREEIAKLREELTGKIENYKGYKEDLAESVKSNIDTRMNELKKEEKTRKKDEQALTNPSLWAKIRGGIKEAVARVSAWNKKRQEAKAEKSKQRDTSVSQEAETTLSRKTAREKFVESNRINPILQECIEASKTIDFNIEENRTNFIKNLEKKYSSEEINASKEAIEDYMQQLKDRRTGAKDFDQHENANGRVQEKEQIHQKSF